MADNDPTTRVNLQDLLMSMDATPRENMMAIYEGRQPEYYADFQFAVKMTRDPIWARDCIPNDGKQHKDSWGTVCEWPVGAPGKHPRVTPENAVVKDICNWKNELVVPSLDNLDWSAAEEWEKTIDRSVWFVEYFCAQGLFERSHFLMGMEDAFCAYLEEPEAMVEMLTAIKDYKIENIKQAALHLHPDVIFFQDDWGSKQNLFLPPDVWREIIKPLQIEIAQAIHDCGMIYVHHSDCICAPIVEDMQELGIDIWQGVITQNPIVELQERTNYSFPMIGGVDGPAIDGEGVPEEKIFEEVHRTIDTYCKPGGHFFPGAPAGLLWKRNNQLVNEELVRYGKQFAQEHPVIA